MNPDVDLRRSLVATLVVHCQRVEPLGPIAIRDCTASGLLIDTSGLGIC